MDYNKKIVNELWQEHEPYIRKLCTYKLKSLPDYVDDCIQDVFLDLSDALHKGKVIEYPKAWLTKVANNKIKDIYAQAKREAEKIVPFESQNLDNTYSGVIHDEYFSIEDEQIPILKEKVINMLDDKEQQLLYDRYTFKKTISTIAKEHNTTENNIYQKLFRLKQKTKMLIEKVLNG
ncbi:MAG: sigma-70 family RNA polymerase sigma factor [Clostridia bacterium]|nr:sigma-70 family RNA polymerase sigma factor [Clostridia bacterium]